MDPLLSRKRALLERIAKDAKSWKADALRQKLAGNFPPSADEQLPPSGSPDATIPGDDAQAGAQPDPFREGRERLSKMDGEGMKSLLAGLRG